MEGLMVLKEILFWDQGHCSAFSPEPAQNGELWLVFSIIEP